MKVQMGKFELTLFGEIGINADYIIIRDARFSEEGVTDEFVEMLDGETISVRVFDCDGRKIDFFDGEFRCIDYGLTGEMNIDYIKLVETGRFE